MRTWIVISVAAACFLQIWPEARARAASSEPTLAIYLVDGPGQSIREGAAPLMHLSLMAKPILADADFVAWDIETHTFVITPAAAKRIIEICSEPERPFVMVCGGERVFAGLFESGFSSASASAPVIMTRSIPLQCFTWPTNLVLQRSLGCTNFQKALEKLFARTNDLGARDRFMTLMNPTTNVTLRVDWGYPPGAVAWSAWAEDRRDEKRIAIAVEKLFGDATRSR